MDKILDSFLLILQEEDLDESRITQLIRSGRISRASVQRAQQYQGGADKYYVKQLMKDRDFDSAQKYLAKKGIFKSANDWLKGVETGTAAKMKQHNIKIQFKPHHAAAKMSQKNVEAMKSLPPEVLDMPQLKALKKHTPPAMKAGEELTDILQAHGAPTFRPGGRKTMHLPKDVGDVDKGLAVLVKRHEADEIDTAMALFRKYKVMPQATLKGHISPEVVRREKELVNMISQLYKKNFDIRRLRKLRSMTGEYSKSDLPMDKKVLNKQVKEFYKDVVAQVRKVKEEIKKAPPDERLRGYYKAMVDLSSGPIDVMTKKELLNAQKALQGFYGVYGKVPSIKDPKKLQSAIDLWKQMVQ